MAAKRPSEPKLDPQEEKQMMEFLTQHVELLQEKSMLQASVREEKKLLVENAKMKKDIEDLKKKLQETQRRKAVKLHQERVLTASVEAMKMAVHDTSPPSEPAPRNQRSNTHTRREGRRREHRGGGDNLGVVSKHTPEAVRDPRPDVSRLDLRVGRILAVRNHPDSESLYVQVVELGDSAPRTVVSELANHVAPEQLQDTLVVVLCNVRPVKVRGVQSQARVLCAVHQNKMEPLAPPTCATPGDRITFQNYPGEAEKELNPKRRVWERLLPDLRTDERGVANYKGVAFEVRGKGLCRAPTISNGGIK
ncbi:aminoacyl tRNA synthase complex-interacting multifunctional protein 1 [Trichomycterus rosablanca]|uniref:aminoacyl tRNA synthase complex-interacting multifunctional protein 1 n=1 Tax=Trichomycterus rosablanca TaxID=2290929 RepID=UPI002F35F88F